MTKDQLIDKINKDIILNDDGFYVYWSTKPGYLNEYTLRLIADLLEERNKEWDAIINKELKDASS